MVSRSSCRRRKRDGFRKEYTSQRKTYVYHDSFTKIVVVWDGLEVGYTSELGVGGVPVLFLAAELGQRPEKNINKILKIIFVHVLVEFLNSLHVIMLTCFGGKSEIISNNNCVLVNSA